MALINCDFFAGTLGFCTSMTVILPQNTQGQMGMEGVSERKEFPVLYLLHGFSDDHTIWLRRTSIERYVASLGLAVVMPNVHLSYYTNMAYGGRYWDFISEELPEVVKGFFPISGAREDTFVAGLSMGGYGAMKLALRQPERFAAAASLSGVMDIAGWVVRSERSEFKLIFGDVEKVAGSENDILHVSGELIKSGRPVPRLFQCCGTGDFLYEDNVKFRDYAEKLGYDLTYRDGPGVHDWAFWDEYIQYVLEWLPI